MEYIYNPSGLMNVEERELYSKDGFHPTLIGDILDEGRYCIVHKLGFGGFATVWLARDLHRSKYVALKILAASESSNGRELAMLAYIQNTSSDHSGRNHVAQMLDHFDLCGPNGQHLCVVFEVLGPSIGSLRGSSGSDHHMKLRPDVARDLAKQCREALSFLHECDVICVGKCGLLYPNIRS
jgi:serine/threonine-protein kinase SRPK3